MPDSRLVEKYSHHCLHPSVESANFAVCLGMSSIDGELHEEKRSVHLQLRNCSKDVHLRRISHMLNYRVGIFSPPDPNIVLIYFSGHMECSLVGKDEPICEPRLQFNTEIGTGLFVINTESLMQRKLVGC